MGVRSGRRRHARAPLRKKVIISDGNIIDTCFSLNISISGIFLETIRPIARDTDLTLYFSVDHPVKTVKATGRVVYLVDARTVDLAKITPGLGIVFEDVDEEGAVLIDNYVSSVKATFEEIRRMINSPDYDPLRLRELVTNTHIRTFYDIPDLKLRIYRELKGLEL